MNTLNDPETIKKIMIQQKKNPQQQPKAQKAQAAEKPKFVAPVKISVEQDNFKTPLLPLTPKG